MYPSRDNDLSSFDEIIADRSTGDRALHVCSIQSSMCFAMEGLMTTLFTPPGCDWSGDDANSLVEMVEDSDSSYAPSSSEGEVLPPPRPLRPQRTRTMTPRKVCSLWKKKRKAEKKRLMALREQQEDLALHSEVKLSAMSIQRSFERRSTADDSDEDLHRASYEKYGSRADFMRDQRL